MLLSSIVLWLWRPPTATAQSAVGAVPGVATFRGGVDLVTVSAVVRDQKGRTVENLKQSDFELLDGGERRAISGFRSDPSAVSVALLFDASGSMDVGAKIEAARVAARHVLAWMEPGRDELAIYSFDTSLHRRQAFATLSEGRGARAVARGAGAVRDDLASRRGRGDRARSGDAAEFPSRGDRADRRRGQRQQPHAGRGVRDCQRDRCSRLRSRRRLAARPRRERRRR